MERNFKKNLSLFMAASMLFGNVNSIEAFAADTKTTDYITMSNAFSNKGEITPSVYLTAEDTVVVVHPSVATINTQDDSTGTHVILSLGKDETTATPVTFTGVDGEKTIDFFGANVTVQSDDALVNMLDGQIKELSFETSLAKTDKSNTVRVLGGQVGGIKNAKTAMIEGNAVINGNILGSVVTVNGNAVVGGKILATEKTTIKDGEVKGEIQTKAAEITGGTISSVKADGDVVIGGNAVISAPIQSQTKIEVNSANARVEKDLNAPEVIVKAGEVTGTITGANILVEKGATVKNIVVNNVNSKVKILGTLAEGATITLAPNLAYTKMETLEITVPKDADIEIPSQATKIEKVDTSSGITSYFEVNVNYYKYKSSLLEDNPSFYRTIESGKVIGSISADGVKTIQLADTIDGEKFPLESWNYYGATTDGVFPEPTVLGGAFELTDNLESPLIFYAVDDTNVGAKDVKFTYYSNSGQWNTATIAIKPERYSDSTQWVYPFPDYNELRMRYQITDLAQPDNQDFIGWSIEGGNENVVYNCYMGTGGAIVPVDSAHTYKAQFRTYSEDFCLVSVSYMDKNGNMQPTWGELSLYFANEADAKFPEYGAAFHPDAKVPQGSTFDDWAYSNKQGPGEPRFKAGQAIPDILESYAPTFHHNGSNPLPPDEGEEPTPEAEFRFEYYNGTTTASAVIVPEKGEEGKFIFPTYDEILMRYKEDVPEAAIPDGQQFIGWSVKGGNENMVYDLWTGGGRIIEIPNIYVTYVAQFRPDDVKPILIGFTYTDAKENNMVGFSNLAMYFASEADAKFPQYGKNIHPGAVVPTGKTFDGWVKSSQLSNPPFLVGQPIKDMLAVYVPKFTTNSNSGGGGGGGGSSSVSKPKGEKTEEKKETPKTEQKPQPQPQPQPSTPQKTDSPMFHDITNHWGKTAIEYVVSRGLFAGVSEDQFAPNQSMTRAMFVTVLSRIQKAGVDNQTNTFNDVPAGQWYTNAVGWAVQSGIVNGVDEENFAPNQEITREQMALMLYQFAKFMGIDVSVNGSIEKFSDSSKVSPWAKEALEWAIGEGYLSGKGDGVLDSKGTATRAEVASILQRFLEKTGK